MEEFFIVVISCYEYFIVNHLYYILQTGRDILHLKNAKRGWSDPQMWTHIFSAIGSIVSFISGIYDLFLISFFTTVFSIFYHLSYEKGGLVTKIEGVLAKLLYCYGTIQILFAVIKCDIFCIFFSSKVLHILLLCNIFRSQIFK